MAHNTTQALREAQAQLLAASAALGTAGHNVRQAQVVEQQALVVYNQVLAAYHEAQAQAAAAQA